MFNESLTPENIARRCILDFVKRGGVTEQNVSEVSDRVIESLRSLSDMRFNEERA